VWPFDKNVPANLIAISIDRSFRMPFCHSHGQKPWAVELAAPASGFCEAEG